MEHVVFYPGPDGAPAFRRFSSLEEGVRFVEHLRNVEEVAEVSVHALTPVPVAFRAYYRVEVPAAELAQHFTQELGDVVPEQPVALAAVPPIDSAEPAAEPLVDPDMSPADLVPLETVGVDGDSGGNGKRTLGFFAH